MRSRFSTVLAVLALLSIPIIASTQAINKGNQGAQGANKKVKAAAGACFDNTNRYVDCGNGTVTDTVTGLIWLQQMDCFGLNDWTAANEAAAALNDGECGLRDGSSPGDWRLPTLDEFTATVAQAAALNCTGPAWTNDAGTGCYGDGSTSSLRGVFGERWSSTSWQVDPTQAAYAFLSGAPVAGFGVHKVVPLRASPVRAR